MLSTGRHGTAVLGISQSDLQKDGPGQNVSQQDELRETAQMCLNTP